MAFGFMTKANTPLFFVIYNSCEVFKLEIIAETYLETFGMLVLHPWEHQMKPHKSSSP